MYRLVILDFDGTLADSFGWFCGILNQVADRYGFRRVADAEIATLRGQDTRAIIRHLGVPGWKLPLIARHMRGLMARDAAAIQPFPGTAPLLRALEDAGIATAVVSSNAEANVRRILGPDSAGRIGTYACGASLFGKAGRFRQLARRAGVAKDRVICIGDETRDIDAARQAGLDAGAVTWGYATADALRRHRPTLLFASPDELLAAVLTPESRLRSDWII